MAHPRRAKANYVVNSACDTASTDEGYTRQHSLPPVTIPSSTTQHSQCLLAGSKHAQGTEQHTHCCADRWSAACCACACAVQVRLRHDSRERRGHSHLRATGTRRIATAAVPPADKEFFANVCVAGDRHTRACGLDLPLVACIHRVRCVVHAQARMSARGYALMPLHLLLPFVPEPTCGKTRSPAHASISQLPRLAWTRASLSVPTRLRQPSSRCVSGSLSSAAQHMSCLSLRL